MGLSLGFADFLVVFSTVSIVLGLMSSSLELVVGISPGMLCEWDRMLCAGPSISKVDLVFSLLICVNRVHCLESWMTCC